MIREWFDHLFKMTVAENDKINFAMEGDYQVTFSNEILGWNIKVTQV